MLTPKPNKTYTVSYADKDHAGPNFFYRLFRGWARGYQGEVENKSFSGGHELRHVHEVYGKDLNRLRNRIISESSDRVFIMITGGSIENHRYS